MRIILASRSPRGRELLEMINLKFEVIVSNCDETFEEGFKIEEQSKKIAYSKAKTVFEKTMGDRMNKGTDFLFITCIMIVSTTKK